MKRTQYVGTWIVACIVLVIILKLIAWIIGSPTEPTPMQYIVGVSVVVGMEFLKAYIHKRRRGTTFREELNAQFSDLSLEDEFPKWTATELRSHIDAPRRTQEL